MGNTLRNLPPPEHTVENTHLPTNFPRKHQRKKTGKYGGGFGSNTPLETSNYQHHWVGGSTLRTECGSGTTARKVLASSNARQVERVFYVPAPGYNRTRSGKCHMKSWESEESPEGCQILVKATTVTRVLLRDTGPKMVAAQPDTQPFWGFLDSFGGEWM